MANPTKSFSSFIRETTEKAGPEDFPEDAIDPEYEDSEEIDEGFNTTKGFEKILDKFLQGNLGKLKVFPKNDSCHIDPDGTRHLKYHGNTIARAIPQKVTPGGHKYDADGNPVKSEISHYEVHITHAGHGNKRSTRLRTNTIRSKFTNKGIGFNKKDNQLHFNGKPFGSSDWLHVGNITPSGLEPGTNAVNAHESAVQEGVNQLHPYPRQEYWARKVGTIVGGGMAAPIALKHGDATIAAAAAVAGDVAAQHALNGYYKMKRAAFKAVGLNDQERTISGADADALIGTHHHSMDTPKSPPKVKMGKGRFKGISTNESENVDEGVLSFFSNKKGNTGVRRERAIEAARRSRDRYYRKQSKVDWKDLEGSKPDMEALKAFSKSPLNKTGRRLYNTRANIDDIRKNKIFAYDAAKAYGDMADRRESLAQRLKHGDTRHRFMKGKDPYIKESESVDEGKGQRYPRMGQRGGWALMGGVIGAVGSAIASGGDPKVMGPATSAATFAGGSLPNAYYAIKRRLQKVPPKQQADELLHAMASHTGSPAKLDRMMMKYNKLKRSLGGDAGVKESEINDIADFLCVLDEEALVTFLVSAGLDESEFVDVMVDLNGRGLLSESVHPSILAAFAGNNPDLTPYFHTKDDTPRQNHQLLKMVQSWTNAATEDIANILDPARKIAMASQFSGEIMRNAIQGIGGDNNAVRESIERKLPNDLIRAIKYLSELKIPAKLASTILTESGLSEKVPYEHGKYPTMPMAAVALVVEAMGGTYNGVDWRLGDKVIFKSPFVPKIVIREDGTERNYDFKSFLKEVLI